MLTHTNSSQHALYNKNNPVLEIHIITVQEALTLNQKTLIQVVIFDNESQPWRLFGWSLSESTLLTQLLIFRLWRREVLMSYFIALFQEVSPC